MTLLIDKRHEFVVLSQHPMGPQLDEKAVAKAEKCTKSTAQQWLNRWKESKDLSHMKRSDRAPVTIEKVDQRISKFEDSQAYCCNRRYTKCFEVAKNQETIQRRLKETGPKFSLPISKLLLTENHRHNRLRGTQYRLISSHFL